METVNKVGLIINEKKIEYMKSSRRNGCINMVRV